MPEHFEFGTDKLTTGLALEIANGNMDVTLTSSVVKKVEHSANIVAEIAQKDRAVYGINTGFGPLCDTRISKEDLQLLQTNILKSHSVGIGPETPGKVVKLMLILKVHALAQGFSGIQLETLERIIWHIQQDILPVVPQQGSVGASGDLAPLAHLFLPLIGLGKVRVKDKVLTAEKVLKEHGLEPIVLGPKEGLALINGTQFIAAYAIQMVAKFHNCLLHADLIGALMLDALKGSATPFFDELHTLRPYKGNLHVAQNLTTLLAGSEILLDHANCNRVQDPYSLRCMPQVHGASRTAWLHLKELLEIELNAVTDNPVIINADLTISGGNFHGQPLALPLDYACLAASELGSISERRTYLALTGMDGAVPRLLMKDTGTNSAFMMLQYTSAALASENKGLCFPASADSIPTSLGQEDHVSMGSIGGRKAVNVIGNVEKILAIELICAAQALDFHRPLKTSPGLEKVHQFIRSKIPFASVDRIFANDIESALQIIQEKSLVDLLGDVSGAYSTEFETY